MKAVLILVLFYVVVPNVWANLPNEHVKLRMVYCVEDGFFDFSVEGRTTSPRTSRKDVVDALVEGGVLLNEEASLFRGIYCLTCNEPGKCDIHLLELSDTSYRTVSIQRD